MIEIKIRDGAYTTTDSLHGGVTGLGQYITTQTIQKKTSMQRYLRWYI